MNAPHNVAKAIFLSININHDIQNEVIKKQNALMKEVNVKIKRIKLHKTPKNYLILLNSTFANK